ncbi:site-specific integrase, partial [Aduncisulcus paluster]
GVLGRNVTDAVAKPEYVAREQEPLTAEQAKQLLRSARENCDPLFQRWATSLLVGARPGEVLGLSLDRCDLEKGVFDFKWQLQYLPQVHGCG